MDYIQFITIMTTMIGGMTIMIGGVAFIYKELKEDIKTHTDKADEALAVQEKRSDQLYTTLKEELAVQAKRSDQLYTAFKQELSMQTNRSDHLYTMFIDLIKEGRKT